MVPSQYTALNAGQQVQMGPGSAPPLQTFAGLENHREARPTDGKAENTDSMLFMIRGSPVLLVWQMAKKAIA